MTERRRPGRPPWSPDHEQNVIIDRMSTAVATLSDATSAYLSTLAEAAEAGVPISYLAELLGVERKTVYRKIGRPMA